MGFLVNNLAYFSFNREIHNKLTRNMKSVCPTSKLVIV